MSTDDDQPADIEDRLREIAERLNAVQPPTTQEQETQRLVTATLLMQLGRLEAQSARITALETRLQRLTHHLARQGIVEADTNE